MTHGTQFTLYSHLKGPNGWKVVFVLEELGLTYETIYLDPTTIKGPEHLKLNPNGRIPTLVDHQNDDFVVWESGAILTYLVENYDSEHKISAIDAKDKIVQLQWLFFQTSGQGPYFGQAAWFMFIHSEKIPSAIERYQKEIVRTLGVLETVLSEQEWLVAGKPTIADLSFITWNDIAVSLMMKDYENFDFEKDFPAVAAWHAKLHARESVKKVLAVRAALSQ